MNQRQRRAFLAPCYRAWDTVRTDLHAHVHWKGAQWSTLLSVNK